MAIVENWKIRKRLGACEHSGVAFEDGEVFHTAIFPEEEGDGFVRRDYSEKSWKSLKGKLEPFSSWRSKYEKPPEEEEPEEVVREDDRRRQARDRQRPLHPSRDVGAQETHPRNRCARNGK